VGWGVSFSLLNFSAGSSLGAYVFQLRQVLFSVNDYRRNDLCLSDLYESLTSAMRELLIIKADSKDEGGKGALIINCSIFEVIAVIEKFNQLVMKPNSIGDFQFSITSSDYFSNFIFELEAGNYQKISALLLDVEWVVVGLLRYIDSLRAAK
jgi:hypothetical protein